MNSQRHTGLRVLVLALMPGALAVAACGGGGGGGGLGDSSSCLDATGQSVACVSGQPAGSILVNDFEYRFEPNTITAKAGKVVLYEVNKGSTVDSIEVVDENDKQIGDAEDIRAGDTFAVERTLKPGTYGLICDIPGHKDAGMTGQLIVS